ncbi:hypothetical protein [Streptomyces sp. NBC_00299]|uniref:hypothetical protein n=1 Tax=Streptomyces sp. NBC_00299 TaxID=2975705 RepID=UPI002E2DB755|nr:hypothetical protein [Streptomyces sp. NBC_00299]
MSKFWAAEGSASGRPLGEISGSFEPPLQVGQLTFDASGVGRQEHGHAVPSPVGHLGRRDPVVQPLRQARVPVVVDAPSGGRLEDVRGQYGLTGVAPRSTDDGTSEDAARLALEQQVTRLEPFVLDVLPQYAREGGMSWDGAGLALCTAFQVALFVDVPRVGPLLSDERHDERLSDAELELFLQYLHRFANHDLDLYALIQVGDPAHPAYVSFSRTPEAGVDPSAYRWP